MWLPRKKSGSEIDIIPSKESLVADRAISRGTLHADEDKKRIPEKSLEISPECLEDNIFCALLKNFASFTVPREEIITKIPTGFTDCEQESKITLTFSDSGTKSSSEMNGSNSLEVDRETRKTEDLEKMPGARWSKRKQRLSRSSRRQSRLMSDRSEKLIKVTSSDIEESPPDDPFSINFDDIYEVTGENPLLLKYLKSNTIKLDFHNGNKFEGEICFKDKDGLGLYSWEDGSKYKGKFMVDTANGSGYMEWADESRYNGFFKDGLRDGVGTMVERIDDTVSSTYSGTWVRGFKSGQGTYKLNETEWYEGDFENSLYNGKGIRQYSSGGKYHGHWKNGKQNGRGIMLFFNNDMYVGDWVDGKMEGNGKYVWTTFLNTEFVFPMHNTYIGQWKEGKRHGVGSLILSTGAILSTLWNSNKKNGKGRVLCVNGTVIEANPLFVNDTIVSMKTSKHKSDEIAMDIEKDIDERQSEVNEIMSDLNTDAASSCIFSPYKVCSTPINIPPYFMNIDIHLNRFFQLDDWYKRITCIDWCQWLIDMPPGCPPATIPLNDSEDEYTIIKCANPHLTNEETTGPQASFMITEKRFRDRNEEFRKKEASRFLTSIDTAKHDLQNAEGKCITYIRRKRNVTNPKGGQTKLNDPMKLLHNSSMNYSNINAKNNLYDCISQIYLFEKKWLRNRIIKHMSSLQLIYNKYATLCCREKPHFEPGLLRILLWKLLKDLSIEETGYSIVEIDRMAVGTNDPFDFVSVSDMIHYLLIISWEMYTKNNLVNKIIPGIIAGGFDLFVTEKVIPLGNKEATYEPLFARCDSIPLVSLYNLYKSLGPTITVKKFILHLTRHVGREHDKHFIAFLPQPSKFFKYTLKGQNIILPGGEILYNPSAFPDFEYINMNCRELPENLEPIGVDFLGVIGAQTLIDIVVKCCPQVNNKSGEIINQDYEICFLEFMEILTLCIDTYLEYKARFTFDSYDENKIKIINRSLDKIIEDLETERSLHQHQ